MSESSKYFCSKIFINNLFYENKRKKLSGLILISLWPVFFSGLIMLYGIILFLNKRKDFSSSHILENKLIKENKLVWITQVKFLKLSLIQQKSHTFGTFNILAPNLLNDFNQKNLRSTGITEEIR